MLTFIHVNVGKIQVFNLNIRLRKYESMVAWVEPRIENKCEIDFFLLTVFSRVVFGACVWLARGSNRQEEQVAPRWVLPGWWMRIGGCCPFTIHVPSASGRQWARPGGDEGRELCTMLQTCIFITALHFYSHSRNSSDKMYTGVIFCQRCPC